MMILGHITVHHSMALANSESLEVFSWLYSYYRQFNWISS